MLAVKNSFIFLSSDFFLSDRLDLLFSDGEAHRNVGKSPRLNICIEIIAGV